MQTSDAQRFFETDAAQQNRQRRSAKSANKYGSPIQLKSKILAVLADPTSAAHVWVAESAGSARRVNVQEGSDASSPQQQQQSFRGPTTPVTSIALGGPSGRTLFAGCWDKTIWSWDVTTRQPGRRYVGHTDFVKTVVCTQLNGQAILVSGGADRKILVWDVASGQRLHTLEDKDGVPPMLAVQGLAVDPASTADELRLASASSDPHVRHWRVRLAGWEGGGGTQDSGSGSGHANSSPHETTVYKVVFDTDTDGDEDIDLWTGSADGTAKCLRASSAVPVETLIHGDHVRAVAVTDAWIVTAGRDENLQFWDRATGQRYATLEGHYDEVTDLAVLADGRRLCSVSLDGTVRTWPLDRAGLNAVVQQQEKDRAGGEEEVKVKEAAESGLTADEEAELAALMEE